MDWGLVGLILMVVTTLGLAYKKYTEKTPDTSDDKRGRVIGHISGFVRYVLDILMGRNV